MAKNTWIFDTTEAEDEFQKLFEKDMLKNPTLAVISSHLWWLALWAKLSIALMLIFLFRYIQIVW